VAVFPSLKDAARIYLTDGVDHVMAYAERTKVPVEKSLQDIQRVVQKHGAKEFMQGFNEEKVLIQFTMKDRRLRFVLPIPKKVAYEYESKHEQKKRQRFRALYICIKAKLTSVEDGIETFDDAFLANIVLPDNTTVGEFVLPQIEASYQRGQMPPMLPYLQ
jgi:hypothetical protein